ncbi:MULTISPECIES: peptidylprolyl isomerase [Mesotoga]|uniref:peptidylprolyl isomerase n=1 Tax=Mesotoga TaxID=1184396 RepID=UPI002B7D4FF3|nr:MULTISPECIES: peptidylprolyl isomerase [Mesotoga]HNQ71029.1 peptidylprolyl isomerase [Mesotoga prima]HNS75929.1 peptidylprolyl isomerase [Mesotoga prima]HOP36918.1 peptidylprolyl isomerase [Mesotoga prima]HPJ31392.1 peptidylprolyl isomerase [Mesotoga prima]HPQ90613.1 peptidylprolyl isomerase [Mesotoga prima]
MILKKFLLILLAAFFSLTLIGAEYAVRITKGGEAVSKEFWITREEIEQAFNATVANAASQGIILDPYFDSYFTPSELGLKTMIIPYIVDEKLIDYFAWESNLIPSEEEIDAETDSMMEMYTSSPDMVEQIEAIYGSMDAFRSEIRNYVSDALKAELVQESVAPLNDDALAAYFEEFKTEIKNQFETIRARHILVTEEATATELMDRINSGEITFAEAALQFSIDSSTAANGGELGSIVRGQTVPEFEEAILAAPIGELYGPVQSEFGYHLIIVEERNEINSLEDVVNSASYNDFVSGYQNDTYNRWIESYIEENKFDYEILDNELLFYNEYAKAKATEETANEFFVEIASGIFGDGTSSEASLMEYAAFIELSEMLGFTDSPDYETAIRNLFEAGEKRGMIVQKMYDLDSENPEVAAAYYNALLEELENTFMNQDLLQQQLSSYGQSFVDYVFNTIGEIESGLTSVLEKEISDGLRADVLYILIRNNSLSLELDYSPDWRKEKLNQRLGYLEALIQVEPSEAAQTEIESIISELEQIEAEAETPAATE